MKPDLKSELDKLPNLRASLLEALFGEWISSQKKDDDYIYAGLHLASGTQSETEIAIVGLFLHHVASKLQEQ